MSTNYVLLTDSSSDLPKDYTDKNNIPVIQLSFTLGDKTYACDEMNPKEFYRRMRAGEMPVTTQVNQQSFIDFFTTYLDAGKDILYIAFSSGLSGTCASAQSAAKELSAEYPDRKIYVVDTLCASLGQGLLVYLANDMKNSGADIDTLHKWSEENKLKVGHSFTVDDLMHLHKGGRVSKASAIAGSLLGIKPTLYVDKNGKLVPTGKVRGRKQAIEKTVDQLLSWVGKTENKIFMVSHADDIDNAQLAVDLIKQKTGISDVLINYVGPVIGTHSGPGTIALFMMTEGRPNI